MDDTHSWGTKIILVREDELNSLGEAPGLSCQQGSQVSHFSRICPASSCQCSCRGFWLPLRNQPPWATCWLFKSKKGWVLSLPGSAGQVTPRVLLKGETGYSGHRCIYQLKNQKWTSTAHQLQKQMSFLKIQGKFIANSLKMTWPSSMYWALTTLTAAK